MMNKIRHIASILGYSLLSIYGINAGNWATSEEGHTKPEINFYGTITSQQGTDESFTVDNITIEGKYKNITVYEMQKPTADHKLSINPTKGIILELNLANIKEISVPKPKEIWLYQEQSGTRPLEYIEIKVTAKNSNKATSYLMETKRNIICDKTDTADNDVQVPMRIPINTLQSLKIIRNESRNASRNNACPQRCMNPEAANKAQVID